MAKRNKNLLIVCQYSKPPSIPGSMRQYEHAQILADYGWHARVVSSPLSHVTHKMMRPVSLGTRRLDVNEMGVDYSWIFTLGYGDNGWRRYLSMFSFFVNSQIRLRGNDRPDVVIGSSPDLLAGLSAWMTARRYRAPFVFEVRDLWPESLVQMGLSNPAIIKPLEALESFLYKQADVITCLTDGIADSIRARIADPSKVHVFPNAVLKPSPPDQGLREITRERMGWAATDVVAIYAGAHGDANDLTQIVDAARELQDDPNIKIVLIGDGPTKASIKKRAEGLANISFLDAVGKQEILAVLQAADIGVMTLKPIPLFEGARPNKLFDYMGASLPIVSTIRGEAEKVLTESASGVGVAPSGLASAIREFASDADKRKHMGASGLQYMAEGETREVVAGRMAGMLDALIGDKRANDAGRNG